jgi:hypothetical protein
LGIGLGLNGNDELDLFLGGRGYLGLLFSHGDLRDTALIGLILKRPLHLVTSLFEGLRLDLAANCCCGGGTVGARSIAAVASMVG